MKKVYVNTTEDKITVVNLKEHPYLKDRIKEVVDDVIDLYFNLEVDKLEGKHEERQKDKSLE